MSAQRVYLAAQLHHPSSRPVLKLVYIAVNKKEATRTNHFYVSFRGVLQTIFCLRVGTNLAPLTHILIIDIPVSPRFHQVIKQIQQLIKVPVPLRSVIKLRFRIRYGKKLRFRFRNTVCVHLFLSTSQSMFKCELPLKKYPATYTESYSALRS